MLGLLAIWVALTWLIGFIYRFAPSLKLPRTVIAPGAALAAAGIVGVSYNFPIYEDLGR